MSKFRMYFIAAGLCILSVGVFAARARFTTFNLYASNQATPTTLNSFLIESGGTWSDLQTTDVGGAPAIIVSSNGNGNFTMYYNPTGTTLSPVYTKNF